MLLRSADVIFRLKQMILCEAKGMAEIKKIVMADCVNQADRRLRFRNEMLKQGVTNWNAEMSAMADIIIQDWESLAASRHNAENCHSDVMLAVAPAWQLMQFAVYDFEPKDWEERWRAAGTAVRWSGAIEHQMIALKLRQFGRRLAMAWEVFVTHLAIPIHLLQ